MTSRFHSRIGDSLRDFAHSLAVQCTGYNLPKGTIRFNGTLHGARVFQVLGGPRVEYLELLAYSVHLDVNRLGERLSQWMTGYSKAMDGLSVKQLEVAKLMDSRVRVALAQRMRQARRWQAFDTVFPTLDRTFAVPPGLAQDVRAIRLTGAPGDQPALFAPFVAGTWLPRGYQDIWDVPEDYLKERIWAGFIAFERHDGTTLRPQPHRPVAWQRGEEAAALPALWAVCVREAGHGHQP